MSRPTGTGLGGYYRALAKLPGVAAVAPGVGLNIQPAGRGEGGSVGEVPADGQLWHQVDVPKVLAGRLPRADRPGEIAIDQNGAALLHLHVGSTLPMVALPNTAARRQTQAPARTRRLTERVVGIVVTRSSVDPVTDIDKVPVILATPALWHRLGAAYLGFDGAYVSASGRAPRPPGSGARHNRSRAGSPAPAARSSWPTRAPRPPPCSRRSGRRRSRSRSSRWSSRSRRC